MERRFGRSLRRSKGYKKTGTTIKGKNVYISTRGDKKGRKFQFTSKHRKRYITKKTSRKSKRKSYKRRTRSRRSYKKKSGDKCNFWNRMLGYQFGSAYTPNLTSVMGNYRPGNEMNTFQQYTGMGNYQTDNHLNGISNNLRSNFYQNKV